MKDTKNHQSHDAQIAQSSSPIFAVFNKYYEEKHGKGRVEKARGKTPFIFFDLDFNAITDKETLIKSGWDGGFWYFSFTELVDDYIHKEFGNRLLHISEILDRKAYHEQVAIIAKEIKTLELFKFAKLYLHGIDISHDEIVVIYSKWLEIHNNYLKNLEKSVPGEINKATSSISTKKSELTSAQVALFFHYLVKGKIISIPHKKAWPNLLSEYGFPNSPNAVMLFYHRIGKGRSGKYDDPMILKNYSHIEPYISKYPSSLMAFQQDFYDLERDVRG